MNREKQNNKVTFCSEDHQIQRLLRHLIGQFPNDDNIVFGTHLKQFRNHPLYPLVVSRPITKNTL